MTEMRTFPEWQARRRATTTRPSIQGQRKCSWRLVKRRATKVTALARGGAVKRECQAGRDEQSQDKRGNRTTER